MSDGNSHTGPLDILRQYWGFASFRPGQEEIIRSVLDGKDTLALMPTGGGKSLCYQVPALLNEGLCLVISPLIALMKDQVENLRKKNITAYAIFSGMTRRDVINTLKVACNSNCKFLYVSPERLETVLFREYLPALGIRLVAVDEAHCISQWGYDFRPPYLRILSLREELPDVPVLALTASATPDVQRDICEKLGFRKHRVYRQPFERPNLSYSVFRSDAKISKVIEILQKVPGPSIVYCRSRKRTKEISELLRLQQISADYYHAGLVQEERNRKQSEWLQNGLRVIVCTNAFGMGIDKPDVRTVIHADVPDCLESYYQEAGRAGRDGKTAFAVLLYDEQELQELEALPSTRFPPLEQVREVYQALANYLQVPAGGGEGNSYDFDFSDFLKKFKLNGTTALYALKMLEQDGWLLFNDQVFRSATVQFTISKDGLYDFETANPGLEPLVKTLLRAFEGIYDRPTAVSEKLVAGLLKKDPETVTAQLQILHRMGVIEYNPQKEMPQLQLLRPRIRAEDLRLDAVALNLRKEKMEQRTRQMIAYIRGEMECRSRMISTYFGESQARPCGICDNCLRQKAVQLTREEFETLQHRIINIVKYESLPARDLLGKLSGFKKEKAWKVLEFLQAENKIEMNPSGLVTFKSH